MWVVEMRGYMPDLDGNGEDIPQGRIAVLEDTDNDGKADKRTVFLDEILLPRSVALVEGGVLIGGNEALLYCKRDGTRRTSEPVVVDPEYAPSGNVEHRTNGLMPHLNNWLYNSKSDQRYRCKNGKLLKDSTQFRGQWGLSMDDFGRIFHNNNSTILRGDRLLPDVLDAFPSAGFNPDTSTNIGSNRVYPIRVTPGANRAYIAKANGYDQNMLDPETHKLINTTASAGLAIYRGDNFPEGYRGIAFTTESVANLVKATEITNDGLELRGEHLFDDKEFLASTDERFRPVNVHTARVGSLFLVV
jgi:glucose/arabinose dehydrogenase